MSSSFFCSIVLILTPAAPAVEAVYGILNLWINILWLMLFFFRDDLTFRLPDLDQEQSDDNLDSESSISSESLLDDRGFSLDSEGQ